MRNILSIQSDKELPQKGKLDNICFAYRYFLRYLCIKYYILYSIFYFFIIKYLIFYLTYIILLKTIVFVSVL